MSAVSSTSNQSSPGRLMAPIYFDSKNKNQMVLGNFDNSLYKAIVVCDQIKKIHVYVKNKLGLLELAECISPFNNVHFTTQEKIAKLQNSLRSNYGAIITEDPNVGFKVQIIHTLNQTKKIELSAESKTVLEQSQLSYVEGIAFLEASKFNEALGKFYSVLDAQERLIPDSLNLVNTYRNIGKIHLIQGNLEEALFFFEKSLAICEIRESSLVPLHVPAESRESSSAQQNVRNNLFSLFATFNALVSNRHPNYMQIFDCLMDVVEVYTTKNEFNTALTLLERALSLIESQNSANSISFLDKSSLSIYREIDCFLKIASIYYKQDRYEEALEIFQKIILVSEKLEKNIDILAACYSNMGVTYLAMEDIEQSLDYLLKSASLYESLPNDAHKAVIHINIAAVYRLSGKHLEALNEYKKSLSVYMTFTAEAKSLAFCYRCIASLLTHVDEHKNAMHYLLESYKAYQQSPDFKPSNADFLSLLNDISLAALKLEDYQKASEFIDKALHIQANFKNAHNTKGLILQRQGFSREALEYYKQALEIDPDFLDARLNMIKAELALSDNIQDLPRIASEIQIAHQMLPEDHEERKEEMRLIPHSSSHLLVVQPDNNDALVVRPQQFRLGVNAAWIELATRYKGIARKVHEHDLRLNTVERRLTILEGEVLNLENGLEILQNAKNGVVHEISLLSQAGPLMEKLLIEHQKLEAQEKEIKGFNQDADLRHYFYALLTELKSAYLAAFVLKSSEVEPQKRKPEKALEYASKAIKLIPVAGEIVASVISGAASIHGTKGHIQHKAVFTRLCSLANDVAEFDQIAMKIAIKSTLDNREKLIQLQGALVEKNWKTKLKSTKDGIESLISQLLNINESKASLLGRMEALLIIEHLQEEAVAENYALIEEDKSPKSPRKSSIITQSIHEKVAEKHIRIAQIQDKAKRDELENKRRCSIQ